EIELRRIERAVAFRDDRLNAGLARGVQQLCFRLVPEVLRTGALLGSCTKRDVIARKAEVFVDGGCQLDERGNLLLDLILAAKDVRIVLRECTHTHETVQRT